EKKTFANVEDLLAEVCRVLGVEYAKDVSANDISTDLIRNIPISFAKSHEVLPLVETESQVRVLTSNPLNRQVLDDLRILFKKRIVPVVATKSKVLDAIDRVYEKGSTALEGLDEIEEEEYDLDDPIIDLLESGEDDAPVIKLVNTLIFRAVKEKAS